MSETRKSSSSKLAIIDVSYSLLLSLPDEIIVNIILFLPKERSQLTAVAFSCHRLFNIVNGREIASLFPYRYDYSKVESKIIIDVPRMRAATLADNGNTIAAFLEKDRIIQFYDAHTGVINNSMDIANDAGLSTLSYYGLSFTKDNKRLFAICQDRIDLYDLTTMKYSRSFLHGGYVTSINQISEIEFVAIGGNCCQLRLYNIADNSCTIFTDDDDKIIYAQSPATCSKDKSILVMLCGYITARDVRIKIYDVNSRKFIKDIPMQSRSISDIYLSDDNRSLYFKETTPYHRDYSKNVIAVLDIYSHKESIMSPVHTHFSDFSYRLCNKSKLLVLHKRQREGRPYEAATFIDIETKTEIKRYFNMIGGIHISPFGDRVIMATRDDNPSKYCSNKIAIFKFRRSEVLLNQPELANVTLNHK